MKLLHSADWHLDSPIVGRTPEQSAFLREQLLALPGKIVAAAKKESCDMMLLSGDLFDGAYTRESLDAVRTALGDAGMPVFIAPGNHDFAAPDSCYLSQPWPENVHIFTKPQIESVVPTGLDCRVYGAAFTDCYSDNLLENFHADAAERFAVGVFHGDPTLPDSPYCPITARTVQNSGLDYLALGHIHKQGSLRAGATVCAWPGCPIGRGFDETGIRGVLIVTLEDTVSTRFLPLDTVRFYDLSAEAGENPMATLSQLLPAAESTDFYRVTLTGECADTSAIATGFPHLCNLELRDRTVPPIDLWATAGDDTLEGTYFSLLQQALEQSDEVETEHILLAARLSRKILDGQEVVLP